MKISVPLHLLFHLGYILVTGEKGVTVFQLRVCDSTGRKESIKRRVTKVASNASRGASTGGYSGHV